MKMYAEINLNIFENELEDEHVCTYSLSKDPSQSKTCLLKYSLTIVTHKFPTASYRPRVPQWLERPLGVWEVGIRSLTVSHQRRKNGRFALFSLALGINNLGIRLNASHTARKGVSFQLFGYTCQWVRMLAFFVYQFCIPGTNFT